MKAIHKRRPSPAIAISLIALFISLGGSAYAVNKIGTRQIQNGAVTKSKLAKSVKRQLKRAARPGPRGERGPQGLHGPQGLRGEAGAAGAPGPAGLIDPNRLYEVTATRTGSGLITAACNAGDWVLSGWAWGANVVGISSMGPQNARRQWTADIILGNEAMAGSLTATCYRP